MALLHVLVNSMTCPIIKNPGAGWARPMYTWDVHRGIQKNRPDSPIENKLLRSSSLRSALER